MVSAGKVADIGYDGGTDKILVWENDDTEAALALISTMMVVQG
jgi:hypothetical protein